MVARLTMGTSVVGWAEACGLALRSDRAGSSIEAWLRGTAVHGPVAVPAHVAWRASAGVVVNPVHAGGAVCTRVAGALVNVDLTANPREARPAATHSDVTLDHAVPTYEENCQFNSGARKVKICR